MFLGSLNFTSTILNNVVCENIIKMKKINALYSTFIDFTLL